MSTKDPIVGFGTAEYVANFLLQESFRYAHQAAAIEMANILFSDLIESIDPDPSWKTPKIPDSLREWLKKRKEIDEKILDPATLDQISEAWQTAQRDVWTTDKKLDKDQSITSIINIVGYVINLTVCLEVILNRHLFLLRESEELSPDHFRSVDRAELMPKLLFCFKEQILTRKVDVSRIKQLVSLRNKAVHYRVDESGSLSLRVDDMIGIWQQFGEILALTSGEPTQTDIQASSSDFITRWVGY